MFETRTETRTVTPGGRPRARVLFALLGGLLTTGVAAVSALAVPVGAGALLVGCGNYDELVQKDQDAGAKWADVEATLQRRYDLIPNLVETAKAAAKFEKETLEAVIKARADATAIKVDPSDPDSMKKFNDAQSQLNGTLSRLLVSAEKYPELKANENFRNLQVQLEGTENRILRAREEYNKAAADYNAQLGKVRGRVVNKVTGKEFKPREFFKMDAAASAAPKVSF